MHRRAPLALLTLAVLTACGPSATPTADTPGITLDAVDPPAVQNFTTQAIGDVQAAILVGNTGKSDTVKFTLNIPGSTSYTLTGPAFATFSPASGTLNSGQASLTASYTCPQDVKNFLGSLTVKTTNATQMSPIPVVLVCNKGGNPQPYLYPSVSNAEPGSTVSSVSTRLAALHANHGPLSVLSGTAIVNGTPVADGFTVNNGDLLALRVQASTQGNTTVAAVAWNEPYTEIFLVATRALSAPAVLYATPTSLDFLNVTTPQTVTITRSSTLALPTVTGTCAGIATATPGTSTATSSYTVQPLAAGSCSLTFTSGTLHTDVPITVTTTSVTAHWEERP